MRITRAAAAAAAAVLAGTVLTSCAAVEDTSVARKTSLTIGVKGDQPGLGLKGPDGTYEGFDVDVAVYLAGRLGVDRDDITFETTDSSERESALRTGKVDMIVATYSITAPRKNVVTYAGPYYVPHQDTLVRADDGTIWDLDDLAGKRLCRVTGSNSWRRVIEEQGIAARPVVAPTYSACMRLLAQGKLDAVSTDDLILAGFAAGRDNVRIINDPFTNEKYGVGLRKGDLDGCDALNRAITQMYQDGTATRLLRKWFGDSGLDLITTVPQFEGCA